MFRLERTDPGDEWDAFVRASPNGTLFSLSAYLEATGLRPGLWYCVQGAQVKAAVALVEMGNQAVMDDFVVYGGLMHQAPEPTQNVSQIRSEQFKVAEFVADRLTDHYWRMAFALHPSVVDVRPWLWVNYGLDRLKHYRVDVRYTSHYDLAIEDPLSRMSQSRRQQVQYARRGGVQTVRDHDVGKFVNMYALTFHRQGESVPRRKLRRMVDLLEGLASAGLTRMYSANTADGRTGSMAVFGMDSKRAYWLWGVGDPSLRDTPCGTAAVWDGMQRLREEGIQEVDLEGVNSPARGWFKLSFGGSLDPYYQVEYK